MWLHYDVLIPERRWSSKNGGKSFTATKGGGGESIRNKQASLFAIRYVVVQCCRYQRSVAAVLENVVFRSEQLLLVRVTIIPHDRNYSGLPYIISVHVQYTFVAFLVSYFVKLHMCLLTGVSESGIKWLLWVEAAN